MLPDYKSHLRIETIENLPVPEWLKVHLLGDEFQVQSGLTPEEIRVVLKQCQRSADDRHSVSGTIGRTKLRLMAGRNSSALALTGKSTICSITPTSTGSALVCRDALPYWSLLSEMALFLALVVMPIVLLLARVAFKNPGILEVVVLLSIPIVSSSYFARVCSKLRKGQLTSAMSAISACLNATAIVDKGGSR